MLSWNLIELDALRYTPAGIPVVNFRLSHASEQIEAGAKRAVQCEVPGLAFEARSAPDGGGQARNAGEVTGFLAGKSRDSKQLVLHATNIEFVEGV